MKENGGNRKAELAKGKDILVIIKLVGGVKIDIRLAAKGSHDTVPHVALSIEIDMFKALIGVVSVESPQTYQITRRCRLAPHRRDCKVAEDAWREMMGGPGFFPDVAFAHDSTDTEDTPCLGVHYKGLRLTGFVNKRHIDKICVRRYFHCLVPVCASLAAVLPHNLVAIDEIEIKG